jgi:hypothetical protein
MSVSVLIDGVIQPIRVDIYSPSTAEPGTIVVDCGDISSINKFMDVSIIVLGVEYRWNNCMLVSPPRWMGSYVRFVLQDQRHMLDQYMTGSANIFLPGCAVRNERTFQQLWGDIANRTGVPISAQASDIKLPAQWEKKTAKQCAADMLRQSAHNMVYDPVQQQFLVVPAGDGAYPNRSERRRREIPVVLPSSVIARSGPVLYESELPARAMVPDDTGIPVTFAVAGIDEEDFFSGFEAAPNDMRAFYRNAAFRWWEVTGATFPRGLAQNEMILQPYRSIPHLLPEVRGEEMTYIPRGVQNKAVNGIGMSAVRITPGDTMVFADNAVIPASDDGTLSLDAVVVACYYALTGTTPDTKEVERVVVGGTGPSVVINADWLLPIESSMPDVPDRSDLWEEQLEIIADYLDTKYKYNASEAKLPGMVSTGGSGKVGAVRYRVSLEPRRMLETIFAFNHTPRWTI